MIRFKLPAPADHIDPAPYVCPGCYAVGEPCAPGCIDAEIEEERERDAYYDGDDDDDWSRDEEWEAGNE